jgi:geranylgeranyl diphosphate synthase type II
LDLEGYLAAQKRRVDETLERLLPPAQGPGSTVASAMRYAVSGGGKRLRPILTLAATEACGGDAEPALVPAAALELIHAYSLVHDDLPAMDDDDLRRGQPTVHRAFGEAEAILAGDALLTLAFELLATWPRDPSFASRRAEAVVVAARRAGIHGMVGGQTADLEAQGRSVGEEQLRWIHRHKTGALFSACAEIGAIHAGAPGAHREALADYGQALGLAFQIADDLLDRTSSAERLGKTPGKDERAGKATYPALFGMEASRRRADELVRRALDVLRQEQLLTEPLQALALYTVARTH